jgi:hypothetical protein|tara:strand:+ start:110 stop:394 length:285 start_codon:yes stop_codon:yes gene_type:complete
MGKIEQANKHWNDKELKIEHGIEMTDARKNKKKQDNFRKAILSMGVGDSVLFSELKESRRFVARAYQMNLKKELTGRWVGRKLNDSAWRVWRIE